MSDCCDPISYGRMFDGKEARRNLKRYRRKGPDPMARSMVEYLTGRGVAGADVLEIGGGVGHLQVELLRAGAASSVNVELSPEYEDAAAELLGSEGLADRVTRRVGDFVEEEGSLDTADVVVLNRVVCCYPFMERMLRAATGKTRRFLALSFPRDVWWMRFGIAVGNAWMALRRCSFRGYVHPTSRIESVATDAGLVARHRDQSLGWQAVVFERA